MNSEDYRKPKKKPDPWDDVEFDWRIIAGLIGALLIWWAEVTINLGIGLFFRYLFG